MGWKELKPGWFHSLNNSNEIVSTVEFAKSDLDSCKNLLQTTIFSSPFIKSVYLLYLPCLNPNLRTTGYIWHVAQSLAMSNLASSNEKEKNTRYLHEVKQKMIVAELW